MPEVNAPHRASGSDAAFLRSPSELRETLARHLALIERNYDIDAMIDRPQQEREVRSYYRWNRLLYKIFHHRDGFMHVGLSQGDTLGDDDVLEPLKRISRQFDDREVQRVLEIGSGNGVNTTWLAAEHPQSHFDAIDLGNKPLRRCRELPNVCFSLGNYHDLSGFPASTFDVVFAVETLCYSPDLPRVMREIYRVLRPGGILLVFEGYFGKRLEECTADERRGLLLLAKAVASNFFVRPEQMIAAAFSAGFALKHREDLTAAVMPTAREFQRLAGRFFSPSRKARLMRAMLPRGIAQNAIGGLLMATLLEARLACYEQHAFEKA